MNYWFSDPPDRVEFRQSETSMSRTALVRNEVCTDLAARGCSMAVRSQLVSCQTIAKTQEEVDRCGEIATAACDKDTGKTLWRIRKK